MAGRRRARGGGLSRDRVLRAALELADAEGLDALSLRRLAARLDVTPMALYRHVESKEALLDGIGDLVLAELELPDPGAGDWREQLRAAARSFRAALVAHPAAATVFASRPLFTPAGLRTADAVLGIFRRAGFPAEQAVLLYQQVVRFLLALLLLETGRGPELSAGARREQARSARATLAALPPGEYPHLVAVAPHLASPHDPERAFEMGLELLLAGLEHALPDAPKG